MSIGGYARTYEKKNNNHHYDDSTYQYFAGVLCIGYFYSSNNTSAKYLSICSAAIGCIRYYG